MFLLFPSTILEIVPVVITCGGRGGGEVARYAYSIEQHADESIDLNLDKRNTQMHNGEYIAKKRKFFKKDF